MTMNCGLRPGGKDAPVFSVHGYGDRLSFRGHRPPRLDRDLFGIDGHNLICLFVIVIYHALAIDSGELHTAHRVEVLYDVLVNWVDDPSVLARPLKVKRCFDAGS